MAKLTGSSPIELLQDSLEVLPRACKDWMPGKDTPVGHALLTHIRITRALLDQVHAQTPEMLTLPNGQSILVACTRAWPTLAVHWVSLLGPRAWEPMADCPFPLVDVLSHPSFSEVIPAKETRALLEEGFKLAMPLSAKEASGWGVGGSLTDEQEKQLKAQRILMRKLDHLNNINPSHTFGALVKQGGAWADEAISDGKTAILVSNGVIPPTIEIAGEPSPDDGARWMKWHEHWSSSSDPGYADIILKQLKRYGVDTKEIEPRVRSIQMQKRLAGVLKDPQPVEKLWHKIKDMLDERKGEGWDYENPNGELLWQSTIYAKPSLLKEAVIDPLARAGGIKALSKSGKGIWDAIFEALRYSRIIPVMPLKKLLKQCPLPDDIIIKNAALWWTTEGTDGALSRTSLFEANPAVTALWAGNEKQQREGAAKLLCRASKESYATGDQMWVSILFHEQLDPNKLCKEARFALACVRDLAHIRSDTYWGNHWLPLIENGQALQDDPLPDGAWLNRVKKSIDDMRDTQDTHVAALLKIMDAQLLKAKTRMSKPLPPARPQRRF